MRSRSLIIVLSCLLAVACKSNDTPKKAAQDTRVKIGPGSGDVLQTESFVTAMPEGELQVPGHGKEVGMAYGAVSGIGETSANGVVSAHYLEDGTAIVGGQVNIEVPEDGMLYEGWLVDASTSRMVSLGHLTNPFNDVRHSVRFAGKNLENMHRFEVSLEKDDGDPARGNIVAEGILKPTKR